MKSISLVSIAIFGCMSWQTLSAQWVQNTALNTPVCTYSGKQTEPQIMSDGTGGAFIAWKDSRNFSTADAFLQRIGADGIQKWIIDGLNVCTNAEDQSTPQMVSDMQGGVIMAWSDLRNNTDRNIYAQRIDSNGIIQWIFNGIEVTGKTVREANEKIISDGEGGAIIIWEQGNGNLLDLWAQRIDANGIKLWDSNGVALSTVFGSKSVVDMAMTSDHKLVCVWQDNRNGNNDVYAQKLDMSGNRLWSIAGKSVIVNAESQNAAKVKIHQDGISAYVAWVDRRPVNNTDIYCQLLDTAGTKMWPTAGVPVCEALGNQNQVVILSDGLDNGFIASWRDFRSGGTSNIYAQKMDTLGAAIYVTDGLEITNNAGDQQVPEIVSDKKGGAVIQFIDRNNNDNVYAQRLDLNGAIQWGVIGKGICTNGGNQAMQKVINDGKGGFIATWEDSRDTTNVNIYAQKYDSNGVFTPTIIICHQKNLLGVYPNPFTNKFTINFNSLPSQVIYTLTDASGKNINAYTNYYLQNNNLVIDVNDQLPSGLYLLNVVADGERNLFKLKK